MCRNSTLCLIFVYLAGYLRDLQSVYKTFCPQPASASSVLLVHLGAVGALASGAALCGGGGTCACGVLLHALHPLQLWTVCGLHADRAAAIAAPLHYAAIVSAKKVIYLLAQFEKKN